MAKVKFDFYGEKPPNEKEITAKLLRLIEIRWLLADNREISGLICEKYSVNKDDLKMLVYIEQILKKMAPVREN
jgi:hypothetical protein